MGSLLVGTVSRSCVIKYLAGFTYSFLFVCAYFLAVSFHNVSKFLNESIREYPEEAPKNHPKH